MHDYRAVCLKAGLVRVFLAFALFCLLIMAPLAQAQTATQSQDKTQGGSDRSVSLDKLADLLENDKSRNQLIGELRQAAAQNQDQTKETAAAGEKQPGQASADEKTPTQAKPEIAAPKRMSFARQFALTTAAWSEAASSLVTTGWQRLVALTQTGPGGQAGASIAWDAFFQAVFIFSIVAAVTVAVFLVLRVLAAVLFSRIARLPERGATRRALLLRRTTAIILGILIDVVVVFIAGAAGYAVGLYGVGDNGAMGMRQSLFINAFILIELIKVVIRAFFAERYENLRPLRIAPEIAAWWSIRLRWFVGVIGYALLVVVPILNGQLTYFAGAVVTFLVMGGAYIYALTVIFRNHRTLTARLRNLADNASLGFFSVLYRLLARIWALLALAYFTTLFVVSQAYPEQALPAMLWASVQTVIAAVVAFSISGLLSRTIGYRISFSDNMRDRVPMLESRLNSYVPNALKAVRVVILLLFVAVTLNIWDVFNFDAWLGTDIGIRVVGAAIHVAIILVAAAAFWMVVASLIEHRMSPNTGGGPPSARQQTLLTLFRNALAILIVGFTALICLSQIGVNIGPLIAGAGVFGLAIGFGAQTLVKDIITGIFIQLENAMNTGDVVELGGIFGTVERLNIRSVSLRDIDGGFHIMPFSSVSVVSNHMREYGYARTEYRIAYREDIDNAIYYLREAFRDLQSDQAQGLNILEDMMVPGVTALDENSVKIHFDRAGIEIPFPHQTLYFGQDRHGDSPAANIHLLKADEDVEEGNYRPKRRRRGDDEAPDETGDAPG